MESELLDGCIIEIANTKPAESHVNDKGITNINVEKKTENISMYGKCKNTYYNNKKIVIIAVVLLLLLLIYYLSCSRGVSFSPISRFTGWKSSNEEIPKEKFIEKPVRADPSSDFSVDEEVKKLISLQTRYLASTN